MKKKSILLLTIATLFSLQVNAQLLNRLADKAIKAAEKGVEKAVTKSVEKTTEKVAEKALQSAEEAAVQGINSATRSLDSVNASLAEANRAADSARIASGQGSATPGAGLAGLMGSYMTLMGVGTPVYEDKGNEVILSWDYVNCKIVWSAQFKGDKCTEFKTVYTYPTPELATQFYREQIDGLDKAEAKRWSVKDKNVTDDGSTEYKDKDKVEVKASMQQVVLAMGGKFE